ncbi:hypothetical protein PSECIP111951_02928 [Pseudoalteromonas holothuriae]|uniref:Histidine kinase n=1 Tax=Pseudoalteromonas holothuriae TaxID=2963714 RepID=A0A9W4W2J8_9GAMM|nr:MULTISPECIES: histidine kinase [unclassified Pseudoalteromonas]CAH9063568.1 hypothetical protein PSECIP111951_02928 [Pseudoalteromonas sp. CIP111951]CAH9064710.1 hypothetical protein PSECIP111854_03517 [Pseudoalteromonas sp. CIP111854]
MENKQSVETVIHDARKPLNHITMNAELLKIMVDKSISPEDIKKVAEQIIVSAKECSETMQQLLK